MAAVKLTADFWKKNKNKTITGKELGTALTAFEKRKKTCLASDAKTDWEKLRSCLADIESAANKTKGKCKPKLHKKTIELLGSMLKLADLEDKTAEQMIRCAHVREIIGGKFERATAIAKVLKPHAATAKKVATGLDSLHRGLPTLIEKKDNAGIRKAFTTITGMQSLMKAPVGAADKVKGELAIVTKPFGSVPKEVTPLKKKLEAVGGLANKNRDSILEVHGGLEEVKKWFEGELMKMTK